MGSPVASSQMITRSVLLVSLAILRATPAMTGAETGKVAWMIGEAGERLHHDRHIDIPTRCGCVSADAVQIVEKYIGT